MNVFEKNCQPLKYRENLDIKSNVKRKYLVLHLSKYERNEIPSE